MKEKETRDREINGIREAASFTGCKKMTIVTQKMTIVTHEEEEIIQDTLGAINIVPAWKWFLGRYYTSYVTTADNYKL